MSLGPDLGDRRRGPRRIWAAVALVVFVASCSGGSGSEASKPPGAANSCGTAFPFDPASFVDPTLDTNPYHPLRPGLQWVRGGTTEVGQRVVPHEVITTMTDVIRVIDGVPTVAMLDESTDSGEVSQVGMDYMALDSDGNVWILGGYTEDYEGGEYTNSRSSSARPVSRSRPTTTLTLVTRSSTRRTAPKSTPISERGSTTSVPGDSRRQATTSPTD